MSHEDADSYRSALHAGVPACPVNDPHLVLGPVVSFNLGGDAFDQNRVTNQIDLKEELRATMFGLVVGAGMEHLDGRGLLSVDARYVFGLTNLFDWSDLVDARARGVTVTLGVGL